MARHESEREDLLREATALVRRIEFKLPHENEPVVVGFRRNGCASFFFGGDPVVQFNTAGELRRLFFEGELLKAEDQRLVVLHRERTAQETVLVRKELSAERQQQILVEVQDRIAALEAHLTQGSFEVVGQVNPNSDSTPAPDGSGLADGCGFADLTTAIRDWLTEHPAPWPIAAAPNAI